MVEIGDLQEGDIVLVPHEVRSLRIDLGLVITRIVGRFPASGAVQYCAIPVTAIESKATRAAS